MPLRIVRDTGKPLDRENAQCPDQSLLLPQHGLAAFKDAKAAMFAVEVQAGGRLRKRRVRRHRGPTVGVSGDAERPCSGNIRKKEERTCVRRTQSPLFFKIHASHA